MPFDEDSAVKFYTDKIGLDEPHARHQARLELNEAMRWNRMEKVLQASAARMQYLEGSLNKAHVSADPDAAKADAFFKEIPVMDGLPVSEKVEHYRALQQKGLVPTTPKMDKSGLRQAAAGSPGSANGRMGTVEAPSAENDRLAQAAGFPSYAAMMEVNDGNLKSQADWDRWHKKYSKKG